MKKRRKIPKWLGKAAALVGILAVLVSSLLVPASAASVGEKNNVRFTANNNIDKIEFVDISGRSDTLESNYGVGVNTVEWDSNESFYLSPTATGYYKRYPMQAVKPNAETNAILDWVVQENIGTKTILENGDIRWMINTLYRSHDAYGGADAISEYLPDAKEYNFYIDELTLSSSDNASIYSNLNISPGSILPSVFLETDYGYAPEVRITITFDVIDYSAGTISTHPIKLSYNDFIGPNDYSPALTIDLVDRFRKARNRDGLDMVSYTFDDGREITHIKNMKINIKRIYDNEIMYAMNLSTVERFSTNYSYEAEFFSELEEMDFERVVILDNTVDADFGSWLISSVGGFLEFEIFPGFALTSILSVIIGFALIMLFLKHFSGG